MKEILVKKKRKRERFKIFQIRLWLEIYKIDSQRVSQRVREEEREGLNWRVRLNTRASRLQLVFGCGARLMPCFCLDRDEWGERFSSRRT